MALSPFSVFSEFIRKEAKARNDPSFSVSGFKTPVKKREKFGTYYKNSASVHKTHVYKYISNVAKGDEDPNALKKSKSF